MTVSNRKTDRPGLAPYATPTVTVIGSVAEVTQIVGKGGNDDGGSGGQMKSLP